MAETPKISVLITCFRLGAFLDEAIDSVLAQSVQDFEILIVDDGSDDPETMAILEGFERPKTQLYRTENQGLARARNFLIEKAHGSFLCVLDADDRLRPRYFEKALDVLETHPEITFVSSWIQAFGEESWVWRKERCDLPALLAEDTVMTAAIVRLEAVRAVGGYDEGMPHQGDEDWELWIRLVASGHQGIILPEVLFEYRRRPGSMSRDCVEGEVHLELWNYLLEKHDLLYREHLFEVLSLKEGEVEAYLQTNDQLDRELAHLRSVLSTRQDWLRQLEDRIHRAEEKDRSEIHRLNQQTEEYRRCRAEVEALRSSWSWRLTRPLRRLADLLHWPPKGRTP